MAQHHANHDHDFFIPAGSIWPPLTCLGAGLMAFGFILHLHYQPAIVGNGMMGVGLLLVIMAAFQWFFKLVDEARQRGFKTGNVPVVLDLANRYGMIFFIVSEIMFFAAFFAGYFYLRGHNPEWPPANIEMLPIHLPVLNTLLLLTSGATVTWAHHALLLNRRADAILATFLTWQLGVIFLACQIYEYTHAQYTISSGVYGSTFFMLTGFHGFHVLVGSLMLMFLHWRLTKGDFTRHNHFYFEATAWYWHFVDVVWIGLFLFVYVL
ncbi:MAG: cytochrome c oxidase subunit 3 [Proteobacteria bacterium]|nr:cytochrome c oxidase subunit 3 [Pseudomonadota bacterium]